MKILVVNAGSSSLKYQLIDMDTETVIAKGGCERIGIRGSNLKHKTSKGETLIEKDMPNHKVAIQLVLEALVNPEYGAIKSMDEIDAVGHRVVHSGEDFNCSVLLNDEVMDLPDEQTILKSNTALGHGIMDNVKHIVYVKSGSFKSSNNVNIAREIEKINRTFTEREEFYILIGPGRWGSSDYSLGIPVKWPHISSARLIVESALDNYRIEPSQGTHFFQNLTSFGVGYFTVNSFAGDGYYDEEYLNGLPAVYESDSLRIVKFDEPVLIEINGRKGKGLVTKPGLDPNETKKAE